MITLESVIKIKEEYLKGKSQFLCHASSTFGDLWNTYTNKAGLKSLANEFLLENNVDNLFFVGSVVLFNSRETTTTKQDKRIRIQFLDWWIAKLTKDSTPT